MWVMLVVGLQNSNDIYELITVVIYPVVFGQLVAQWWLHFIDTCCDNYPSVVPSINCFSISRDGSVYQNILLV